MSPEVIQRITTGVSAVVICACLAVGSLAFTSGAEARAKAPRNSDQEQLCGWIQDLYGAPEVDSPEEQAYLENMLDLEAGWYEMGCDRDYGSIVVNPAPIKKVN